MTPLPSPAPFPATPPPRPRSYGTCPKCTALVVNGVHVVPATCSVLVVRPAQKGLAS